MTLHDLGWTAFFENQPVYQDGLKAGYVPGRIAAEHKTRYELLTEQGELSAEITGVLRFRAEGKDSYPVVGDWVMALPHSNGTHAVIKEIFERATKISRKTAGVKTEEQPLAANIDVVAIVSGLDRDFNVRRIERYMVIAWNSGARPILVLNKADLCEDIGVALHEAENAAPGVPVIVTVASEDRGIDELRDALGKGTTSVLLGSSGVGKSSLINALAHQHLMKIGTLSDSTHKGRHTTTRREMVLMPAGGIIIDTPGMRELQLWDTDDAGASAFEEVEELALQCKFTDCRHETEPGCAVRAAIEAGTISEDRFENYKKVQREAAYLERRQNQRAAIAEKNRWRILTKDLDVIMKLKGKR